MLPEQRKQPLVAMNNRLVQVPHLFGRCAHRATTCQLMLVIAFQTDDRTPAMVDASGYGRTTPASMLKQPQKFIRAATVVNGAAMPCACMQCGLFGGSKRWLCVVGHCLPPLHSTNPGERPCTIFALHLPPGRASCTSPAPHNSALLQQWYSESYPSHGPTRGFQQRALDQITQSTGQ
jgi:hypothetical protein